MKVENISNNSKGKNDCIRLTHFQSISIGWVKEEADEIAETLEQTERVVYLGECAEEGDMFVLYADDGSIFIYKGNLNNGKLPKLPKRD